MSATVPPAVLSAVAAVMLAFAAPSTGAADTELQIRLWREGRGRGAVRTWTLRCDPAGGTLPRSARACGRLAGLQRPFAPVRKDVLCTQIHGGPQEALVSGRHRGARIAARLSLTDGCQIERWRRIGFLTPGYGGGR